MQEFLGKVLNYQMECFWSLKHTAKRAEGKTHSEHEKLYLNNLRMFPSCTVA
jgi:hypothetical protein